MYVLLLLIACSFSGCSDIDKSINKNASGDTISVRSTNTTKKSGPVTAKDQDANNAYISYIAKPSSIRMFWKHKGAIIKTFSKLKNIEPALLFAMNGGMYTEDFAPVGLYVEKGKQLKSLKRYNNPKVNFGLQPQGVFLIRKGKAEVIPVEKYTSKAVRYATQSAPMVVLNSRINPKIPKSNSRTIRNGVGILPDGQVLMACSKGPVTFMEFASYFKTKGCITALYLDGGISSTTEGGVLGMFGAGYGVMIGVVKD